MSACGNTVTSTPNSGSNVKFTSSGAVTSGVTAAIDGSASNSPTAANTTTIVAITTMARMTMAIFLGVVKNLLDFCCGKEGGKGFEL